MSKYIINASKGLFIICIILIFDSCKKFVQIEPSSTTVVTANVFDKNSTATAAQLAIYAQMQTYPFTIEWATGLSSDELKNYSTSNTTAIYLYTNKLNAVNDAAKIGIWSPAYNFIYQANAILEALSNSPGVTAAAKDQLAGESKFVRAFWNFYLVNLYGDIPLALSTDYTTNTNLTRTPKAQVYQQIVDDLTDAQNLLNNNFVDASDTIITTERVRPTKWAATALLARTYLYMGDWAKAEAQSTAVVNNSGLFKLSPNLNSVYLKNSTEAIWQLMVNSSTKYTSEGSNFIVTTNPASTSGSFVNTISNQLLNAFETGDARKTNWLGTYTTTTSPVTTYYFAYKYKATSSTTSLLNTEYTMVLRLAEQYLIRAEARAQQNNLAGAVADLNSIRNRAGLPNYTGIVDQPSLISAIMHERQVELFAEGHRWLDVKRTNTVDAVMNTVATQKGSSWQSYQQLYPIPVSDIQNSGEWITQNPNY
jgi:hypothetical protein